MKSKRNNSVKVYSDWFLDSEEKYINYTVLDPKHTRRPRTTGWDDAKIASIATRKAKEWGYKFNGEISSVVGKLGGQIRRTNIWDRPDKENGSLMVLADGSQFIIWVSDRSNPRMLLYTVAHELGHYVLHCIMSSEADTKKHFFAARHQVGEVEAEADKFAINFLAPKRKIKKMLSSGNSVRQVSDELCVDVHLVKQQIKKYGLQFS